MKILNKLSIFVLALGLFASCNLTPEVAPFATYDGEANMTIAELIALHTIGSSDSYDTIPAGTVITGIVTTSDEHGNCYKYINIEDETGGIQIKINSTGLYNRYKVGQRVFIQCDGLVIGDYRKLPQLGYWANDGMQGIPSGKIYKHIFCDGKPTGSWEPVVTLSSIPNVNSPEFARYMNCLVRLDGTTFLEGGQATYSLASAATSHDLKMLDGTTITMRTSNYADFINETLPTGTGTVIGILTRYNNYAQITIRDLNDVQGFTAPTYSETIFSVNNYDNAFNEGWLNQASGANWEVMNTTSFSGFRINANAATNSTLVSPSINLSGASDVVLSFSHRSPQVGTNVSRTLLITDNYNGANTNWTTVTLTDINTSTTDFTYTIPAEFCTGNFRFAYQFEGSAGSWYISNIGITGIVNK